MTAACSDLQPLCWLTSLFYTMISESGGLKAPLFRHQQSGWKKVLFCSLMTPVECHMQCLKRAFQIFTTIQWWPFLYCSISSCFYLWTDAHHTHSPVICSTGSGLTEARGYKEVTSDFLCTQRSSANCTIYWPLHWINRMTTGNHSIWKECRWRISSFDLLFIQIKRNSTTYL